MVNETDLIDALQNNIIAGAALDVYANEPHVPEQLMSLDNVVLTPHIASGTSETFNAMADLVLITYRLSLADSQLLPLLLNKAENMIYGDITYLSEQQNEHFILSSLVSLSIFHNMI